MNHWTTGSRPPNNLFTYSRKDLPARDYIIPVRRFAYIKNGVDMDAENPPYENLNLGGIKLTNSFI